MGNIEPDGRCGMGEIGFTVLGVAESQTGRRFGHVSRQEVTQYGPCGDESVPHAMHDESLRPGALVRG